MNHNWVKIYSGEKSISMQILQIMLQEQNIEVLAMNKADNLITHSGIIELYVPKDKYLSALAIVNKNKYQLN
jgi:hypothetical protein